MDTPVIEMQKSAAAQRAAEYRYALENNVYPKTEEGNRQWQMDQSALLGFNAIAQGKRVIDVRLAMNHAGLFTEGNHAGLPKLAIARADAIEVQYDFSQEQATFHSRFELGAHWSNKKKLATHKFGRMTWDPVAARRPFTTKHTWRAIVPTIPPHIRPRYARLASHAILWEANWNSVPIDPFLLRYISGNLYSIEAEWDLSELEQAILSHAMVRP